MPGNWAIVPRSDNDLVTADIYNGDRQDIVNHIEPLYVDDYSATVAQMQAETNPGAPGAEVLATSLAGELERIRYVLHRVLDPTGPTWYSALQKKVTGAPVHDVTTYGATGNGVTDDGAPIQAALDAASAAGGQAVVVLPPGTYKVSSGLVVHGGLTLRGAGTGKSKLVATQTSGAVLGVATNGAHVTIEMLSVSGPASAQPGLNGVSANTVNGLRLTAVEVLNVDQGVVCANVVNGMFDAVSVGGVRAGFTLSGNTRLTALRQCTVSAANEFGFYLSGAAIITLTACSTGDTGRTTDVPPCMIIGSADIVAINFAATNPAAKTAAAIQADAGSARVVVPNCFRSNIGAVNLKPSINPWSLIDGQMHSVWALRAWGVVQGSDGAVLRGAGVASVSRTGPGRYNLTWAEPFAAATDYGVVVSPKNVNIIAGTTSFLPGGCSVGFIDRTTGGDFDTDFSFQVSGVRV